MHTETLNNSSTSQIFTRLAYAQKRGGVVGKASQAVLKWRGTDIPPATIQGERLILMHTGIGIVLHGKTKIMDDVTIFHNVTVGRADIWRAPAEDFTGATIKPHAILCAGAVILPKNGELVVGEGTIIGANAVLTESTGDWEIWAGSPARKVGERQRPAAVEAAA